MHDDRRRQIRDTMVARLERVRGQMTDAEFEELITAVERTAARFAEIDAWVSIPPRSDQVTGKP